MPHAPQRLEAALHCYVVNCGAFGRAHDANALRALDDAFEALREAQRAQCPGLADAMSAVGVAAADLVNAWLAEEDARAAVSAHDLALLELAGRIDEARTVSAATE